MSDVSLLDLAQARLAEVERKVADRTLDDVLRRLFDPRDRDRVTVSAFGSAL